MEFNNNPYQYDDINYNKKSSTLDEFIKLDFSNIDTVYSLIDDYFFNKDEFALQIANNKLNSEIFNIKGVVEKYTINPDNNDINNNELNQQFIIEITLKKINLTSNVHLSILENNNENNEIKYKIKLLNVSKESKLNFKKNIDKYYKPILAITNLEANLEKNDYKKYEIQFVNTENSKIYIEIQKIFDKNKKYILRKNSQLQIINIFFKNNFNEIKKINYQKIKEDRIKKYCRSIQCFYDIKNFLEIETETLYVENLKSEFYSGYLLKTYNIDICCLVKKISSNDTFIKRKGYLFITLENIFDLNQIILEVPNTHDILKGLEINCIYIFKNLTCFIDENFNVKLGVIKIDNNKSTKIGLYEITDNIEYTNSKIKNLFKNNFNQLISLTTENKLIRSLQKYLIYINSVMYVQAHLINGNIFYEGCLIGSDGTSTAFFSIENDCVKNLFKFNKEFDDYIRNKLYNEKKFQIFPGRNDYNFDENIILKVYGKQVVIVGVPKMNRLMEISAQDMYDSISELKKYSGASKEKKIDGFLRFDTQLTKIEFSMINGSFSKKSDKLEKMPYIKSQFLFEMEEYVKLGKDDNIINKI